MSVYGAYWRLSDLVISVITAHVCFPGNLTAAHLVISGLVLYIPNEYRSAIIAATSIP